MKILTMNLWHGLSPSSLIAFERLEPEPRRILREELQIKLIREVAPDIAFFQEVNPVTTRFEALSRGLKMHGCLQPDLVGIKLLGFGLPAHLFSGLVTLAQAPNLLRKVKGLRLSGHRSFANRFASFQLREERYALFSETVQPGVGRILLINTHLHHGLENTEELTETLAGVMDECEISSSARAEIRERLAAGNVRRARELSVLIKELEHRQSRYAIVILGGDFNAEPQGELGQRLRDLGFVDAWKKDHPDDPGYTFDRELNLGNHILQDRFPSTLMLEDLSFSAKTRESLTKLAVSQERRRRRIDQLWIRSQLGQIKSIRSKLVGFPDAEGLAPSDHFGLVADLDIE